MQAWLLPELQSNIRPSIDPQKEAIFCSTPSTICLFIGNFLILLCDYSDSALSLLSKVSYH